MRAKKEIKKEIEQWEKLCNNYESLADSMLVTALAFYDNRTYRDCSFSVLPYLKSTADP